MLVTNAKLAGGKRRDIRVEGGQIEAVEPDLAASASERVRDAEGRLLLPGAVDAHVHFREPGFSHKETWGTGSQSAAAGGVTTVVDQPNTDPPTVSAAAVAEKAELAAASLVDYGINGGVTPDWSPESLFVAPITALGEVFLADSTGDMGIDAEHFADAVSRAAEADVVVTVHAEDATEFDERARERSDADAWSAYRTPEAEIAATDRALEVGADRAVDIHIAHTSTPEAADRAAAADATCEATPHHLLLSRDDLDDLGPFGRMNPPLRSEKRRSSLYDRLVDGTVDIVATDHAPHTRAEKDGDIWSVPSGVPGVETMLPLLLDRALNAGDPLTVERLRDATARRPAEILDLPRKGRIEPGADADLVCFERDPRPVEGERLHSSCGWTPFEGETGVFPVWTMVRGEVVYERPDGAPPGSDGERFGGAVGENVRG